MTTQLLPFKSKNGNVIGYWLPQHTGYSWQFEEHFDLNGEWYAHRLESIGEGRYRLTLETENGIDDERTVEVRGSIKSEIQCIRTTESDIIYSAEVGEYTPVQRPSIIVSCVHSGRSLWDIAKEYRVRAEDILRANALENEDAISKGATLIIPK